MLLCKSCKAKIRSAMRHGEFGEKAKYVLLDIFKREIIAARRAGQTYQLIATQYGVGKATMYRFIKEAV